VSSQNQSRQIAHPPPEDIFDSAVERLTAGESLGSILASVPKNLHDEISDMLTIVEFTQQMQSMPVPVPARPARTSRKLGQYMLDSQHLRVLKRRVPRQPN